MASFTINAHTVISASGKFVPVGGDGSYQWDNPDGSSGTGTGTLTIGILSSDELIYGPPTFTTTVAGAPAGITGINNIGIGIGGNFPAPIFGDPSIFKVTYEFMGIQSGSSFILLPDGISWIDIITSVATVTVNTEDNNYNASWTGSGLSQSGIRIQGQYTILTSNVTIDKPHPDITPGTQVIPNDPITVHSPTPAPDPDPDNPNLDDVHHIELKLPDDTLILILTFTIQNSTTLSFTWPSGIIPGTSVIVTAVTFWGRVPLGTFTVIIENGSGIYQIVRGKVGDTIYLKADVSDDTKQSAVLSRARIGFISG